MMSIDMFAQMLADISGLSREYAYMLLGGIIGFVVAKLVSGARREDAAAIGGDTRSTGPGSMGSSSQAKVTQLQNISLQMDGNTMDIDPAAMAEIQQLLKSGKKIDAIKRLREITGLDLTAAKALSDVLEKT